MATMAFEDLRLAAEVFLSQWSVLNVKEEVMMATGSDGTVFISNWDNWLLPPAPEGLEPLLQLNGYVLDPEAAPPLYTIAASGDSVRGRVALATPAGPDAILLATFRRNLFRQSFWVSNVKQAIRDITQRLLYDFVQTVDGDGYPTLDDQNDPWHIVVKQAGKNALVNLQTMLAGFGKALPLDAGVLTPYGMRTMAEIQVGDYVVGKNGQHTVVLGVFPQGEMDVYRVAFSDGTSVECTGDHLWQTKQRVNRIPHVLSTLDIARSLTDSRGVSNHSIPMTEPVEFAPVNLPLDAYLLGALLGDGCFSERSERVSFTNTDSDIMESLGLYGRDSHTKFIPEEYKLASVWQRIELLQGLMDTDGHVSKNGMILEYSTTSRQLADDVAFVVETLGGTCVIAESLSVLSREGKRKVCGEKFRLTISLPSWVVPFKCARKSARYAPKTKYPPHRIIRSVELVGSKQAQCIKVAAQDGLFLTEHCIVTHNTTVENVTIDLSRAHSMIHEVIDDLEGDIDRDVVAWRWKNSPGARRAYTSSAMSALRGPGPFWGLY